MTLDPLELVEVPDAASAAQMQCILADLGQMYQERNEALREVARAHHEVLLRLALAADFKDDDTGIHIVRIAYLAEQLALRMGESAGFARLLRDAAPMHDIGKIGIPDNVLKKPGPLDAEEWTVMRKHPAIGAQILGQSRIALFQMASQVALTHHERWDGAGYPAALAGDAIPLCGRIVAVVDFFDALTMDRVYRKALPDDLALGMLAEQRGHAFDPRLVDCFLAHSQEMIALRERVNVNRPTLADLLA
jgi:putative two-component system response regulator